MFMFMVGVQPLASYISIMYHISYIKSKVTLDYVYTVLSNSVIIFQVLSI